MTDPYDLSDWPPEARRDFNALFVPDEDDETKVDLGGGMVVPLSELLDDDEDG